jgi:hypothetical protein
MGYGRDEYERVAQAMSGPLARVSVWDTCAYCGHVDHATEFYSQTRSQVTDRYCRNHNACQRRANEKRKQHMSDTFNWDNPEYRTSEYWKWEKPGDTVTGTITAIGTHTFDARQQPDGTMSKAKTVPVITVDDGGGQVIEVTCSNADLLEQIRKAAPQVGDKIHMEYLRDVPTSFGGKKKLFTVKHKTTEKVDPWADDAKPADPIQEEAPF